MEPFKTCPRCGETLKPGFLRTGQRSILWTPSGESRMVNIPMEKGEFELPGASLWHGARCPSQYCGKCGLILTETEEIL